MTVSNHRPYTYPDGRIDIPSSKQDFTGGVKYTDLAINDFIKITEAEPGYFDDVKGESDSLAGLIMEITQNIPSIGDKIEYGVFTFIIESADRRKINRIKTIINPEKAEDE